MPDSARNQIAGIPAYRKGRGLAAAAAVLLAAGVLVGLTGGPAIAGPAAGGAAADPPVSTDGPCKYTTTPEEPPARPVGLPPDPRHTPDHGTITVMLRTNHGKMPLILQRKKAPCTVQSFLHLVRNDFYDKTICHRLTAYPTLKVLQCGDPSGTGEGGPGYKFKDELPTDLEPAPTDPTGVRKVYPRGTLAMANAGPDTNGSQFFVVYGEAFLRPNYTIFGRLGRTALATLDRIAAGGVQPTPEDPHPVDGPPALPTNINKAHALPRR